MDIISIISSIMLVLICIYFILSPFTIKGSSVVKEGMNIMNDNVRKEELYATLNEIEMDFKMNKLSEEDYQAMKKAYELQVAEIMKTEGNSGSKIAQASAEPDFIKLIEAEIDAELAALRNERKMKS